MIFYVQYLLNVLVEIGHSCMHTDTKLLHKSISKKKVMTNVAGMQGEMRAITKRFFMAV